MPETILKLTDIKKTFDGEKWVSDNISLSVKQGEIVALLGPSGCGKTTLLRLIAGFEAPNFGKIDLNNIPVFADASYHLTKDDCANNGSFFGNSLKKLTQKVNNCDGNFMIPTKDRKIGYVVQEGILFPHMSVFENIAYGLDEKKLSKEQIRKQVEKMLKLTGILPLANRKPHELSGGQQQRVALARALAPEPKLILLDEPFSALDEHLRISIREEVMDILKAAGTTVVLVTHDREEAIVCSDRMAILWDGKLLQYDTPKNIYYHPVNLDVALFVGEAVLLDAVFINGKAKTVFGAIEVHNSDVLEGSIGHLMLRPEQIHLSLAKEESDFMKVQCQNIKFKGAYSEGLFTIDKQELPSLNDSSISLRVDNTTDVQAGLYYHVHIHNKGYFYLK